MWIQTWVSQILLVQKVDYCTTLLKMDPLQLPEACWSRICSRESLNPTPNHVDKSVDLMIQVIC